MPENVLQVETRINTAPILAGNRAMLDSFQTTTSAAKVAFSGMAASTAEAGAAMTTTLTDIETSIDVMATRIVAALERVNVGTRKVAAESTLNLGEAGRAFSEFAAEAEVGSGAVLAAMGPMLGALAGLAAAGIALSSIERSAISIHKFAEETGMSTTRVQEFRVAMELLHVGPEQAETSLIRLNNIMTRASEGMATQHELMKRLIGEDGIQAWKNGTIDLIGVLERMQNRLGENASANERLGVATTSMGRNAKEMALVLGLSSDQLERLMNLVKETNGVMDPGTVDVFVRANQQLTLIWNTIKVGLSEALTALLPIIKFVITAFSELALYVRVAWEAIVQLVNLAFAAGGILAGMAMIISGNWATGTRLMEGSVKNFEASFHDSMNRIIASNARASSMAKLMWDDSTQQMLDNLTRIKDPGAGTDLLEGISGSGKTRMDVWKGQLEEMRSASDAFHGVTLEAEQNFWQHILTTQKLSAKERTEVTRELNNVLHKMALEHYQDQIAFDQEFIAAQAEGSAARVAAVVKERDDIEAAWGQSSKQAIAANMKVLEAQVAADKKAADDVRTTTEQNVTTTKAGTQARIDAIAAGIAQLRAMEDNLNAGKSASGGPIDKTPVAAKPEDDAALRNAARQQEIAVLDRLIQTLLEKATSAEEEYTTKLQEESFKRSSLRAVEAERSAKTSEEAARLSAEEQIKQVDRLAQYDLISFKQKIEMTRAILEAERARETAAIEAALKAAQANLDEAATEAQVEAATRRITALKEEQLRIDQQIAQKEVALSDQLKDHEIKNAEQAASIISTAFDKAFNRMIQTHEKFGVMMRQLWQNMVTGFEQAAGKILANEIKTIALRVLAHVTGAAQIAAAESAGAAATSSATGIAGLRDIFSIAWHAAAKAWDALAGIPIVGPALGAAAAAATFAGILAIGGGIGSSGGGGGGSFQGDVGGGLAISGIASAASGMVVPHDMIAAVHENETILPRDLSKGLNSMINNSRSSTSSSSRVNNVRSQVNVSRVPERMTDEDIAAAVARGQRLGFIRAGA